VENDEMSLLKKLFTIATEKGFIGTIDVVLSSLRSRLNGRTDFVIERRRHLSHHLDKLFDSTVAYGPFRGLKMGPRSSWGTDRGSMLLGLYEQEILDVLSHIPSSHRTFVDLGAADGYYSVGGVFSKLFDRCYCFEASEYSRAIISSNAKINGVSDKIVIYGVAKRDFYKDLPADILSSSVMLIDIEGAEFDLLDKKLFEMLKGSIILIEVHEFMVTDGADKLKKMKNDASDLFNVAELTTSHRDLSKIPEIRHFKDDDRWLLCSEGRNQMMTWLILNPK
jgi:Methyltransferase FkbM domain